LSTPAARSKQRAYRRRLACGRAVLRVEVQEHELAEALIASGRLGPVETLSRAAIESAVAEIVCDWIRRWPIVC
jgi:hypothetical protein